MHKKSPLEARASKRAEINNNNKTMCEMTSEKPNVICSPRVPEVYYHTCGQSMIKNDRNIWQFCPKCGERLVWPPLVTPINMDDFIEDTAS